MSNDPTNEIIKYDDQQSSPIQLDLLNNQIVFKHEVDQILSQTKDLVEKGNQLVQTDINQIDEQQMTALNKEIKPIAKIQKQYLDTRKSIQKQLQTRNDTILNAFDAKLNENHFNELQTVVKKLHVLQKDYKANRANKRWASLIPYFNAQMQLYPELKNYADQTLGNFNYYRIHHSDLISEAKTKPVTKNTIKKLNEDLYQYHNDLKHLFESDLNGAYYQSIIDHYANEPSTNKILDLIQQAQVQQIKDQNVQQQHVIDQLVDQLWTHNPKLNQHLDRLANQYSDHDQFIAQKQTLIDANQTALKNSIDINQYLNDEHQIDQAKLEQQLKLNIKQCFQTVSEKLAQPHQLPSIKPAQKHPTADQYQWLLEYLQDHQWSQIHDNDKIKAQVLRELYLTITDHTSIWHQKVHSNHDLIALTKYITNL